MIKILFFLISLTISPFVTAGEICKNSGIAPEAIKEYFQDFDLTKHDEKFLGHTLARHVGKSQDWLEGRLVGDRHKKFASSYKDLETANKVIKEVILENHEKIQDWLENKPNKKRLSLSKDFKAKIGIVLTRDQKTVKDCNIAVLVLKRVSRDAKDFFIITSYPVSNTNDLEEYEKYISWSKYPMQDRK
jgi:hypothetical protein